MKWLPNLPLIPPNILTLSFHFPHRGTLILLRVKFWLFHCYATILQNLPIVLRIKSRITKKKMYKDHLVLAVLFRDTSQLLSFSPSLFRTFKNTTVLQSCNRIFVYVSPTVWNTCPHSLGISVSVTSSACHLWVPRLC